MRSNGLATILLMIPILAVPALAIFGIPELTPFVDSGSSDALDPDFEIDSDEPSKSPRSDQFGEIEGITSDSDFSDDLSAKRNNRKTSRGGNRIAPGRQRRDSSDSNWDDDQNSDDNPSNQVLQGDPPRDAKDRLAIALANSVENEKKKPADNEQKPRKFIRQPQSNSDSSYPTSSANLGLNSIQADSAATRRDKRSRHQKSEGGNSASHDEQLTWNSAVERLNELEIHSFRLEPGKEAGQFIFICSYSPEHTPRVSYRFEAGANEPLKAIEKVLAQISEWHQRQ